MFGSKFTAYALLITEFAAVALLNYGFWLVTRDLSNAVLLDQLLCLWMVAASASLIFLSESISNWRRAVHDQD